MLMTLNSGNTASNPSNNSGSWRYWIQPILRSSNQTTQLDSHPGCNSMKTVNSTAMLAATQPSKLDSHPGCNSIKPVNWTAILAATRSNQSVNPGGRQADLKEGLGGGSPPASYFLSSYLIIPRPSSYFLTSYFLFSPGCPSHPKCLAACLGSCWQGCLWLQGRLDQKILLRGRKYFSSSYFSI